MPRPDPRDFLANWRRTPGSVPAKCRMVIANNWTKLRTTSRCCGHHGQPGC